MDKPDTIVNIPVDANDKTTRVDGLRDCLAALESKQPEPAFGAFLHRVAHRPTDNPHSRSRRCRGMACHPRTGQERL